MTTDGITMTTTLTRSLALAAALALTVSLSACGSGDDEKAAEAISAEMMKNDDTGIKMEQEQADCIGEGMVDKVGVDKLKEYGMLTDNLEASEAGDLKMSEADANSTADVFMGCVDAQKAMAESMASEGDLTEEQKKCMSDALDDDTMRSMFSLLFQGKDEDAGKLIMEPALKCAM